MSEKLFNQRVAAAAVELVRDRPDVALSLYSVNAGGFDVAIVVARTPQQAKRLREAMRALDNNAPVGGLIIP